MNKFLLEHESKHGTDKYYFYSNADEETFTDIIAHSDDEEDRTLNENTQKVINALSVPFELDRWDEGLTFNLISEEGIPTILI